MPHSSLTRWLKQGLDMGMCPLCRAAHKLDREFIWYFFDERTSDDDAVAEVTRARGFCSDHADQLKRVEVDGTKSTLGIGDVYANTLEGLALDLRELEDDDWLATADCPACVNRDEGVSKNARYLLEELVESEGFRERYRSSVGLCVPHFRFVWDRSRTEAERVLLREVQLAATEGLLGELREHLRKQRAEFRHEPSGPEADSWQRAIWLTSGWPAPREHAGVPESHPARQSAAG